VLCCAVLCCAVLCCAVLCCAVLCCAVLCCAVLCCAVLCTVLCTVVCAAESCDVACSRTLGVPAWGVCVHPGSADPGQCCDCSPIPHQPVRAGLGVVAWGEAWGRGRLWRMGQQCADAAQTHVEHAHAHSCIRTHTLACTL
jgi:hypothetical protein